MSWAAAVAWFFGGVFFANAWPHLIAGMRGRKAPTPFASPPFKGLSSPATNVAWALVNLVASYALLVHVGELDIRSWTHSALPFTGFAAMALQCARAFGRLPLD